MLDLFQFYALVQALLLFAGLAAVLFFVQRHHQAKVLALSERCDAAAEALLAARANLLDQPQGGDPAVQQQLQADLAAQLVLVQALEDKLKVAEGSGDREEQLKQLVQQFTRDSREMLQCIRKLEHENAELLERLGEEPS